MELYPGHWQGPSLALLNPIPVLYLPWDSMWALLPVIKGCASPFCCRLTSSPAASAAIQQLEGTGKAHLCRCSGVVSNTGFPPPSSRTQVISALSVLEGFGTAKFPFVLQFPFSGGSRIAAVLPHSSGKTSCCLRQAQKGDGGREVKAEITLGCIVRAAELCICCSSPVASQLGGFWSLNFPRRNLDVKS